MFRRNGLAELVNIRLPNRTTMAGAAVTVVVAAAIAVGTVASGSFSRIGGGKLGSKTYHFLTIPLETTLPNEASGIQSHAHFHWGTSSSLAVTRDTDC